MNRNQEHQNHYDYTTTRFTGQALVYFPEKQISEKKPFRVQPLRLILLVALVGVIVFTVAYVARAAETETRWIICQPDSFVNVRESPSRKGEKGGYLELGDAVETDGVKKNGYLHVIGITEAGEGWVKAAYAVSDKPVRETFQARISAKGRVAVRETPGGKRTRWLHNGMTLTVYAYSEEWAVTHMGFVQMQYLEEDH